MKICICSDIHGNGEAFKSFLKDINRHQIDKKIFCGDVLGYYYDANEILDYFRNNKEWICLLGNHDNYLFDLKDNKIIEDVLINKYGNSYKDILLKISEENIYYLKQLKSSYQLDMDGINISFFHGGPNDSLNERIYPDADFNEIAKKIKELNLDYIFCGHTHHKLLKQIEDITIVNPGSIGQQRDGKGCSYVIFDTKTREIGFYTFEYNKDNLVSQINNNETNEEMRNRLIEVLNRSK